MRTCRVVVADDAAGMRALIHTVLTLEPDFDVVGQACDGAQAVALVEELAPDLLVIDVTMPVMSGLEAIEVVRKISPGMKVVVFSGERLECPAGADAIIEKGTPNEVVVKLLRELAEA